MSGQIIIWLVQWIALFLLATAFLIIFLASIYDIISSSKSKISKRNSVQLPSITILIYCQNCASVVSECIDSIRKSDFVNYDIVVADDVSTDNITKVIKDYNLGVQTTSIRLYRSKRSNSKNKLLLDAYKRSKKGDLVLVLDATCVINNILLRKSAIRFALDKKIDILRYEVYGKNIVSLITVFYRFEQLSLGQFKKAFSLLFRHRIRDLVSGAVFRRQAFKMAASGLRQKATFSDWAAIRDSSVNDRVIVGKCFNLKQINLLTILAVSTVVFFQTYSMMLAAVSVSFPLIVGWSAVLVWTMAVVWLQFSMSLEDKFILTFAFPLLYFLVYVRFVVLLISAIYQPIVSPITANAAEN